MKEQEKTEGFQENSAWATVSDGERWKIPPTAVDDGCTWYAVRLLTLRLKSIVTYVQEHGFTCFLPVRFIEVEGRDNRRKRVLRPVVSNLLFLKNDKSKLDVQSLLDESPYPMMILRRERRKPEYYEISSKEMFEFMLMCNPEIELRKYLTEEEAQLKVGTEVEVCHGPLKGLCGKLVRQNKKYYLLKEVPGIGVMVKVSRWCCKPL